MKKPKKLHKDLGRIEAFLTKEKERLNKFETKRHDRRSVSHPIAVAFHQRMAERQALMLADLEAVQKEIAVIEAALAPVPEPEAPETKAAPVKNATPVKNARKPAPKAAPAAKTPRAPRARRPATPQS
ncbi:MAG: hypothetical protein JWL62_2704 [Hyphomicrobiales bacterium]|nr:hypothetical protein [Hyphomicrobiales bacterium]